MTVARWSHEWLETYKRPVVAEKSYKDYKRQIDSIIIPAIDSMRLRDVKDIHLQKIMNSREGLSLTRVKLLRNTIHVKLDNANMMQSRIGRCIDNGPMEAFWGTLKAEMYYLNRFCDYDSLKLAIEQYITFYSTRYQEKLDGLAPLEYRIMLLSA